MQSVTVLGSTGSIGVSTLDVLARHPERYRVYALTANQSVDALFNQIEVFSPRYAVLADATLAQAFAAMAAAEEKAADGLAPVVEPLRPVARARVMDAVAAACAAPERWEVAAAAEVGEDLDDGEVDGLSGAGLGILLRHLPFAVPEAGRAAVAAIETVLGVEGVNEALEARMLETMDAVDAMVMQYTRSRARKRTLLDDELVVALYGEDADVEPESASAVVDAWAESNSPAWIDPVNVATLTELAYVDVGSEA